MGGLKAGSKRDTNHSAQFSDSVQYSDCIAFANSSDNVYGVSQNGVLNQKAVQHFEER